MLEPSSRCLDGPILDIFNSHKHVQIGRPQSQHSKSGRPRGSGKALKNVGVPGPPEPARLRKRTPKNLARFWCFPGSSPVRIRPGGSIYGPEALSRNYLRPGSIIARMSGSRGQVRPETGQKQNKHYNLYPLGGRRLLDRTTYSKLVLFRFHRSLKSRTGSRLPDPAVLCGSRPCRGSGTLVCGHKPPAFTVPLTFCMRAMRNTCHGEQHIHRHTGELPGLPEITQFILEGTRQNGWWG